MFIFRRREKQIAKHTAFVRNLTTNDLVLYIKGSRPGSPRSTAGIRELIARMETQNTLLNMTIENLQERIK